MFLGDESGSDGVQEEDTAERALTCQGLMPHGGHEMAAGQMAREGREWTWGPVAGRAEDGSEEQRQARDLGVSQGFSSEGQGWRVR